MNMEATCDGGFNQGFGGSVLTTEEVQAIGSLLDTSNSLSGEVTLREIKEYQDMAGNKKFRTDLAEAYLGSSGETGEVTEELLFDLELGFLHRFVYELIWKHIVDLQPEEDLVGKAELMLKALQRGGLTQSSP